ncbi:hypothetical protein [Taklimakanibacter albus]|uniref:Uncharacterized protein n=1 Tax=Taklimakanibacter albus TaxID=2800327 RepID=A0ACC5QX65_9HYPH|nr:hypothetical protein [Aestuariivirga sp. YIM B02566]MBK1864959.1 hypothetical protein [Aestuariivirga sp. YIM B02566]
MKILRSLVLAAAFASAPPAARAEVVIRNDWGGVVRVYYQRVLELNQRGESVRIGGTCGSACTLYLAVQRYCVEADARLRFHAVHLKGNDKMARLFTRWLFSKYPPAVQAWIKGQGGLSSRALILRGEALRKAVRICP